MRILFIVRSFAPDGNIASKRPAKFAKYLSYAGHDVYVIRSGLIFGKADFANLEGLQKVKTFSYEGSNSPADRFERGETLLVETKKTNTVSNWQFRRLLQTLRRMASLIIDPLEFYRNDGKEINTKICELYNKNLALRGFDVVISSFSPVGCIQAGEFISICEKAVWVIDFRDLMDNQNYSPILRWINAMKQAQWIKKAHVCLCVSEGNTKRLQLLKNGKYANKIYTVYNGYETETKKTANSEIEQDGLFHICYTGSMHGGARSALPLFAVLNDIQHHSNVRLDYAGSDASILKEQAALYGMMDLVVDHGYLSNTEVVRIQEKADLFLVLSWNTHKDQGILTGKFYESIQNRKPVIALVSGDVPNSELKMLIDRYSLGVCYEEATKKQSEKELRDYILKQYKLKQEGKPLDYFPKQEVFSQFEYRNIVKKLEQIMVEAKENAYERS